jgi:phospholipase C
VWSQPDGSGVVLPFHPDAADLGLAFLEDLPHGWPDTQKAWNDGKYDQWIPNKGQTTMAYLTRDDIPYHYALADAFTVCDAYHCSFFGSTDPNRYHLWSGWIGNDGRGGGPVLDNAEEGYEWVTFPERLQQAGISWKIYQDAGEGLDAEHAWGWGPPYIGNYGDNSLLYFKQYQNAPADSPLAQAARTGTNISAGGTLFDAFIQDIANGRLPQVSWIVAPEAYSEHPNWPPNYGAWFISQILDALTANPDVFAKTVLFINYDENDGFFDHIVPPTPPMSRAQGMSTVDASLEVFGGNEVYAAGPIGLGVRVPMLVVSPWSKGGWVSSEVFDHTSIIRFIERRFARQHPELYEPNITPWRRAVAGDLTRLFDFDRPSQAKVVLPSTHAYVPPDAEEHPDYKPTVPSVQVMPKQEPGLRPARPVPYVLAVEERFDVERRALTLKFRNTGTQAAVFQVRTTDGMLGPWTYTVGAKAALSETFPVDAEGAYDLSVYGPNGFMRTFKGSVADELSGAVQLRVVYHGERGGIGLLVRNSAGSSVRLSVEEAYEGPAHRRTCKSGDTANLQWSLSGSYGWYDITVRSDASPEFERRLAGHVETGRNSMSDPALGR